MTSIIFTTITSEVRKLEIRGAELNAVEIVIGIASYEEVIVYIQFIFVYTILPPSYSDRRSLDKSLCPFLSVSLLHSTARASST